MPVPKNPASHSQRIWGSRERLGAAVLCALGICLLVLKGQRSAIPMDTIVLKNGGGVEVHVIRRGAIIQRLLVPDKAGKQVRACLWARKRGSG